MWRFLHLAALGYPEQAEQEDADRYERFFDALGEVLPCPSCGANYKKHLSQLPIRPFLSGRDALFDWTVRLHNLVNEQSGKAPVTVEQAKTTFIRALKRGRPTGVVDGTAVLKRAVWAGMGGGEPVLMAVVGAAVVSTIVLLTVWLRRRT